MRRAKHFFIFLAIAYSFLVCSGNVFALKYSIDGDVSDWGIDLTSATTKGYLDAHRPNLPSYNIMTEDNDDNASGDEYYFVGPGYSFYNKYDAEAIYFDNDDIYGYIAIITGVRPDGWVYGPGDIGIDVDPAKDAQVMDGYFGRNATYARTTPYEYAITMEGDLVKVDRWNSVKYIEHGYDASGPYSVNATDQAIRKNLAFSYSDSPINDHYVIEVAFLLSDLGLKPHDKFAINWTMGCGNDFVRLDEATVHTPEPTTIVLLGSSLIGLASFARKGRRNRGS